MKPTSIINHMQVIFKPNESTIRTMKPTLSINHTDIVSNLGTLGMLELLTSLRDSNLFEIQSHNERISTCRGERATILYYNGKKIYLDFWEYSSPTYSPQVMDANFDLIIKLQHKDRDMSKFEAGFQRKRLLIKRTEEERIQLVKKIVPWTFFPSRLMLPFIQGQITDIVPTTRFGFFCGKTWKCRKPLLKKLKEFGLEILTSDQAYRTKRPLNDNQYLQMMRSSKFGIVLAGRVSHFTEGKNRREMDYMILKKPLLLNYRPYYYNPLIEGKHYIYINDKTDFKNLENMYNIEEIAKNGHQWYLDNASPKGSAKVFQQIMKDKFGA